MPQQKTYLKRNLDSLEYQWRDHYTPYELHRRLRELLSGIRHELNRSGSNARIVSQNLRLISTHQHLSKEEMARSNQALKELLQSLGITLVGLLPGAFITLPTLFALARHYNIDLLPKDPAAPQLDTSKGTTL